MLQAISRRAAVLLENVENASVRGCRFESVGGTAVAEVVRRVIETDGGAAELRAVTTAAREGGAHMVTPRDFLFIGTCTSGCTFLKIRPAGA